VPAREEDIALGLLLRFYMNTAGKTYAEVAEGANVPTVMLKTENGTRPDRGRNVANFHNSFASEHVDKIRGFLEEKISQDDAFKNRSPIIDGLINTMRGHPIQPAVGLDRLLSAILEDGSSWKERVAKLYAGVWYIVRFAAHVGIEDSRNGSDPWMVYAIMEISAHRGEDDFPCFTILYRPWRDDREGPPRKICGNVLSLRGGPLMLLIGVEGGTALPLIIAADQERDKDVRPGRFKSLVVRKVERGSFISGYAMFIRSKKKSLSEIAAHRTLGTVGLFPQSQVIRRLKSEEPSIGRLINSLRNVAKHKGNAMLCLD